MADDHAGPRISIRGHKLAHIGRTGLAVAYAVRGGGVSYRPVHQASMITSWMMLVSMV